MKKNLLRKLNFPTAKFKFKINDNKTYIFDEIRKKIYYPDTRRNGSDKMY